MDGQVGSDDNPRDGGAAVELSVTEGGGRSVVENVEELERLLLDDEEDGVEQLPVCITINSESAASRKGRNARTNT